MIRIDLGKDELNEENGGGGKKLPSSIGGFKLPKSIEDLGGARGVAMIVVGAAFAALPHLFFGQYRGYVVSQHEARMKKLDDKLKTVKEEIQKFSGFQKEQESYELQKKMVKDRLDIVKELLGTRSTPVSVLDAIGQSLPQRVWISGITLAISPRGSSVEIAGEALSNEDVSDYVDKLSESVYLSEVKLQDLSTGGGGITAGSAIETRKFQIVTVPKVKFPSRGVAAISPAPPVPPPVVVPPPSTVPPPTPAKKPKEEF